VDYFYKGSLEKGVVPRELLDLHEYFRMHGPINFEYKKEGDIIVAVSTNFRFGSIITSGRNEQELDENIKDAIMTSFDLPSSFAKEAKIYNQNKEQHDYALA